MPRNNEWLEQVVEESLEPDLPICDPHHHLWDLRPDSPEPRYLLDDLLADTNSGHNIVSTIFIECHAMYRQDGPEELKPVGEVEFVNGIAAMSASGLYGETKVAAGIIGHADLTRGAAAGDVLDALDAAGGGRFRGIRHAVAWDKEPAIRNHRTNPPEHRYMDPVFREGLAQLGPRKHTFEAWCYMNQIGELADMARNAPDVTIILNHFGGPLGLGGYEGKREEVLEFWRGEIVELAKCENVVAKLGGLNMDINGFHWHEQPKPPTSQQLIDATRPFFEHTIEQFGVDRCMFESNFPVDKLSCSYNVCWNSFKILTKDYSADEKAKLYHDTATRVYSLD
ncbi:MAG: amidohydrolase family protein [Pseudomonadota bacterium]